MESQKGYQPKLSWFKDMFQAFNDGKIKSFKKGSGRKLSDSTKPIQRSTMRIKNEEHELNLIEVYDFEEQDDSATESNLEIQKYDEHDTDTIIEPYEITGDEQMEPEEIQTYQEKTVKHNGTISDQNTALQNEHREQSPCEATLPPGIDSNELFLKSLQSTLDRLSAEKNMRARIKIQEALYQIAFEK